MARDLQTIEANNPHPDCTFDFVVGIWQDDLSTRCCQPAGDKIAISKLTGKILPYLPAYKIMNHTTPSHFTKSGILCYCAKTMIRHTVVFKLKHTAGSVAEINFLHTAQSLAMIPTVKNFERLRQVSHKNEYDFGFSMEFASRKDYEIYNAHPIHTEFVENRWIPEVVDFLEIDYVPYIET